MAMVLPSYLVLIHVKYTFLIVQHTNVNQNYIKAFHLNSSSAGVTVFPRLGHCC